MDDLGWARRGECNHCGWCCQNTGQVFLAASVVANGSTDVEYYRTRGYLISPTDDGNSVCNALVDCRCPCPQHVDNRCAVYDSRPRTCQEFPKHPTQIVYTPCSHWFEQEGVRVGGTGSPYPQAPWNAERK